MSRGSVGHEVRTLRTLRTRKECGAGGGGGAGLEELAALLATCSLEWGVALWGAAGRLGAPSTGAERIDFI